MIKQTLSEEVLLTYPTYEELSEIYTDALQCQIGAVIMQDWKPIAFFLRKLNNPQKNYSIAQLELLPIVECQ